MKRLLVVLFAALVSVSAFAQAGSRKLVAGVYDFVTVPSAEWSIIEPSFKTVDPVKERIVFMGSFVEKGLPGFFHKYDFTCTVARNNDDFSVEITNLTSVLCDRRMRQRSADRTSWTSATAGKYAEKMKADISKRMASWSDAEYETKLNDAVTSPMLLGGVESGNALAFKKFIKDYAIIGRHVKTQVYVESVDEAPSDPFNPKKTKEYEYLVRGKVVCGYSVDERDIVDIKTYKYADVEIYTNNDDVVSLSVGEKVYAGMMVDLSSSSMYEVSGTIKDISSAAAYGINIEITE